MIQTIRDAELKINSLKLELDAVKKQLHLLSNRSGNGNGNGSDHETIVIENKNKIDSEVSSDGGSVMHKLYHIFQSAEFQELQAKILRVTESMSVDGNLDVSGNLGVDGDITGTDVNAIEDMTANTITSTGDVNAGNKVICKLLDVVNGGNFSQVRVSSDTGGQGFWLMNLGPTNYILSQAYFNGSWIAAGPRPQMFVFEPDGSFKIFGVTGDQTPGTGPAWNLFYQFTWNGGIQCFTGEGTAATRTNFSIYSKAEVDTLINNAFSQLVSGKANHGTYPVSGGAGGSVTI